MRQFVKHFARQAVELIRNEKEKKRMPTIIAPITLVAANVTANKMTADSIVPNTPNSTADKAEHTLLQTDVSCAKAVAISITAR